ncbi:MAG: hypothetical protein J6V44_11840 [Methanobrevibacter sp.]|jgi:uncharacterized protein YodC (DUF2158 family)|nr:hypothetical protein [Methanobrevibacter sp.]
MDMISNDKVFFNPGDVVALRHRIDNIPTMYVIEKVTRNVVSKEGDKESMFIGIKCRWFDANQVLREAVFSTKDLIHVSEC